ncbi:MAG: type II secretion system F family protein [Candidatus Omnitrophica bacterium]|nr:type II secretion system F family protein [Candidatus Omnitrophota bacterium]
MPTYKYKVRDKHGRAVTGLMGGANEKEVIENLKKMGYTPISISEQKEKKQLLKIDLFNRVKDEDKVIFTRQLYTLLKAGVPILTALEAVSEQTTSKPLKATTEKMKADVEAGVSFSEALSKHPAIFGVLYSSMVRAGEASGTLDDIMRKLAEMGEYDIEIKQKVAAAIRYPLIALGTLVVAFFVLVIFVIPRFASFFGQFNIELPLPTRILMSTYHFVQNYWYLAILAVVATVIAFVKFINIPFGRKQWDMFKLKVPIFGPLVFKMSMSRFSKTTSTLIASGISMLETLELTAETVGNVIISGAVRDIKEGVNQGKGLAEPMKVSKLFTPIVIQMVSIGEETGKLDELLVNVSEHYDQQVDYAMKNLTTLIEPILIVVLGMMVLFVALGIFLPMWNIIQIAKQ